MDLTIHTFKSVGRTIGLDVRVIDGRLQIRELLPRPLWARRLSSKSSFCRAVVWSGLLTRRQMVHAALRYRLGRSKDDAVIYWQIDQLGQVHDGKLMWYGPDCHRLKNRNASWVMFLLKQHLSIPQAAFQPTHVFFGTHLLSESKHSCVPLSFRATTLSFRAPTLSFRAESRNLPLSFRACREISEISPLVSLGRDDKGGRGLIRDDKGGSRDDKGAVAIVEAEKSAVILSELYPQYIWLATGGMDEIQVNKFMPLAYYKVILFPDTDPDGRAFTRWYDAAQKVMEASFWPRNNPIRVSPILELNATPDQKRRKIDLVDYIMESQPNTA